MKTYWHMAGALALLAMGWRRSPSTIRSQLGAAGLVAVIFVSPLCAMGSALFSIRAVHHLLLTLALAPLLKTAPLQAIARLHAVVGASALSPDELGRPRDAASADRLRGVMESFLDVVDEPVVRAITATDSLAAYLALVDAVAG